MCADGLLTASLIAVSMAGGVDMTRSVESDTRAPAYFKRTSATGEALATPSSD